MSEDESRNEQAPGHPKEASATVYLVEELGDARLRCDQLVRYVAEGVRLVESSPQKEKFYETAGHLIQAVPLTLFKLQKSLQAVALAANRIDYDELRTELRPEKVQQLESVLEDARIRQINRHSEPLMTPQQVAAKLRQIAATTRDFQLPQDEVVGLIATLERGPKTAGDEAVSRADLLNKFADLLEAPHEKGKEPSRLRLAAVLRRMVGDVHVTGHMATLVEAKDKQAIPPSISAEDDEDEGTDKQAAEAKINIGRLERMVNNTEEQLKVMKHGLDLYKKDPGRYAPQLDNIANAAGSVMSTAKMGLRALGRKTAEEEKQTRFEEGKPADPTKNMTEEEAKEWKAQTEKHKDEFKKASDPWKVDAAAELKTKFDPSYQQQLGLMMKNPPKVGAREGANGATMHTIEVFSPFIKKYIPMAEHLSAADAQKDLGVWIKAHRETLQSLRAAVKADKNAKFEKGEDADKDNDGAPDNLSAEDAKEWKAENAKNKDKFKKKEAASDWKAMWRQGLSDGKAYRTAPEKVKGEINKSLREMVNFGTKLVQYGNEAKQIASSTYKLGEVEDLLDGASVAMGQIAYYAAKVRSMSLVDGSSADMYIHLASDDDWKAPEARSLVAGGLTKMKLKKLMEQHGIPGEVSGAGTRWEVELPDEKAHKLWERTIGKIKGFSYGGYRTGYGGWVFSPDYKDKGDWNDRTSPHHYAADVSKQDWQKALKADEAMLRDYEASLKKLQQGGSVPNLTVEGAKSTIEGLKAVIQNKKGLISKLAEEDKQTKFKEGEPADPTKEMSEEEAKEWKANTKKYEDKFKKKEAGSASELKEMEGILKEHGYNPRDAKKLQGEGMGTHELERRIKSTKPGAAGSLEYTHGLKKKANMLEGQGIDPERAQALYEAGRRNYDAIFGDDYWKA